MALPVKPLQRPAALQGQTNGRLDPTLLAATPGQAGGATVTLLTPAAHAWQAMTAAAARDEVTLRIGYATSSYRPHADQERIFRQRYTTTYLPGRPSKLWNGVRWYQRPGTAVAATPGTSNHGWGLAVDVDLRPGVLDWLLTHAHRFGWSWEIQSEPWHIRYIAGDNPPPAVTTTPPPVTVTTPPADTPGGFLMALTNTQQTEIYDTIRKLDRLTPLLVRRSGTEYHKSVCLLFRATGQMISLEKKTWDESRPMIDFFKTNLGQDRVITLPAGQYDTYRRIT